MDEKIVTEALDRTLANRDLVKDTITGQELIFLPQSCGRRSAQSGRADGSWKEAKLETGLQIMVPLFIEKGEIVRVDTIGKKYLGRETSEG